MNKLQKEKRVQIINLLILNSSLRAISRISVLYINAVTKLLIDLGWASQKFHEETVRGISTRWVQCNEICNTFTQTEKSPTGHGR